MGNKKIELGVAYYGNIFPDNAREDLREMSEHGCNSVLIAMSEYDWRIWRKNIFRIAQIAKNEFNFNVYINFWAWGGVFGGEACSFFLHDNTEHRQVISTIKDGESTDLKVNAACFNDPIFRNYLKTPIKTISKKQFIDGFFWDEPHYYYTPKSPDIFTCCCKICQTRFKELYDKKMPTTLTDEVIKFKENMITDFLKDISSEVKNHDPKKKVIVCLTPPPLDSGIKDWDKLLSSLHGVIDVFGSDPYWLLFGKSLNYVSKYTKITVDLAKKYKLASQLWCLGFLVQRNKENQLQDAIEIFDKQGADSIFTWCYRGAEGMSMASANPKKVWKSIGTAYNNLKRKYGL
ncbi:MAG: hypothetical protein GF317_15475 [Candidatus Lokiarchaeota archaeon]|nr:hypothetical protein [Candidatus Lokiarchaeota archaeon]MBD3228124.1 hypothetical protein [Candidatus Lokiarchaeota archaeon]